MRDQLADHEWSAIRPMHPNKPRGIPASSTHLPQRMMPLSR